MWLHFNTTLDLPIRALLVSALKRNGKERVDNYIIAIELVL